MYIVTSNSNLTTVKPCTILFNSKNFRRKLLTLFPTSSTFFFFFSSLHHISHSLSSALSARFRLGVLVHVSLSSTCNDLMKFSTKKRAPSNRRRPTGSPPVRRHHAVTIARLVNFNYAFASLSLSLSTTHNNTFSPCAIFCSHSNNSKKTGKAAAGNVQCALAFFDFSYQMAHKSSGR